jgi:FkbM family methyltransferase
MLNPTYTAIRRKSSLLLRKAGVLLIQAGSKIYQSPQQRVETHWIRDRGDKTLRLYYDLDGESIVFDLGGYEGQWASDIYGMYSCYIHVFEPVGEYVQRIEKRFSKNRKVIVHRFGLADETKLVKIAVDQDSSSMYKSGKRYVNAQLIRTADFLLENKIQAIDLMKINIEGGEYDLLEHLINIGYMPRIRNIQVQFHDFVPDAKRQMKNIQDVLRNTHYLTYQYPFIWENWRLNT